MRRIQFHIAKLLLNEGKNKVDPDKQNIFGKTAFSYACEYGRSYDIVKLLFEDSIFIFSIKILSILTNLSINKNRVLINTNLILNMNIFRDLINIISINIIKRIKKE